MKHTTHTSSALRVLTRGNISSIITSFFRPWRIAALAVLSVVLASSAQAQSVRFKSTPVAVTRITLSPGYTGAYSFTNLVTISGTGGTTPVEFTVAGLPGGATCSITATNGDALPLSSGNPSSLLSTNILLTFSFTSVANGTYPLVLNGSNGATNQWPFVLQVGSVWFSPTNNVTGGTGSPGLWGTSASWSNNAAPGTADDVIFTTSTAEAAVGTNIIVDDNKTVGSVRFAGFNNTTAFHTMLINPGFTLSITNTNGFSMLRDYAPATSAKMTITIVGTNATLAVSNESALFAVQAEGNALFTLNMAALDNLRVNVNRMPLGDYQAYPYFMNYVVSNQYGDVISKFAPAVSLARTNIIRAIYADPNNYTDGGTRSYGLCLVDNYAGGSGSSPAPVLNLGVTNSFYVDGMCFVHGGGSQATVGFNAAFSANNPSALFRGTNGGRMSIMTLADFAGPTNVISTTTPKSTVNFLLGTINVLVDRFYMSMDRYNTGNGAGPQSTFTMGAGVFDCNTAILGYESYGNHTNNAACTATMVVSNGTLRVNNSLTLGYTTDVAGNGSPGSTHGLLTLWGGTNYINSVSQGGVTKLSTGNAIILTNGAMLVISNTLCDATKYLDNLNLGGGNSSLAVFLDSTNTTPVVYASAWNVTGVNQNNLVLMAIKHPGGLVNGQEIPLLEKASGGFPSVNLVNLSGFNGSIVQDGVDLNRENFKVILNAPKNLVWKGTVSADWDNVTKNWQDTATGLATNFLAGDTVKFDDSASQFNLNLVSGAVILPGSVLVTNLVHDYTINNSAGGSIIGSITWTKSGSKALTIDAPCSDSVQVNNGTFNGAGSVNSITANSGTLVNFSGPVGGNVDTAGIAILSGTVNGGVIVESGGAVTNIGTVNSAITVNTNGLLVNNPSASLANIGSSATIAAGGTFVNRGSVSGGNLTVNGTLLDTGEGTITLTGTLTASAGATIIPGGNGVGTTTVLSGGGLALFPGRILLSQGSSTIFKMDIVGGVNTKLLSSFQDFGVSSGVRSANGCTLVLTNVTGSFAAGQSFTMFQYSGLYGGNPSPTGSSTNTYPAISPATPGPGLSWDLTQLWPSGVIGVIHTPIYTFTNSFVVSSTNVISSFSWDPSLMGYRLETLITPNTLGLAATNWSTAAGSWTNTSISYTNDIVGTNSVFYRLVYP